MEPELARLADQFDELIRLVEGEAGAANDVYALLEATRSVRSDASEFARSRGRDELIAATWRLEAELALRAGAVDDVLEALRQATSIYESIGESSRNYGKHLFDSALTLANLGLLGEASTLAERSVRVFGSGRDARRARELVRKLGRTAGSDRSIEIRAALKRKVTLSVGWRRSEHAFELLGELLRDDDRQKYVEDIHKYARIALRSSAKLDMQLTVLETLIDLYFTRLPLPHWVSQAVYEVRRSGRLNDFNEAVLCTLEAAYLLQQQHQQAALSSAIEALCHADEFALGILSQELRASTRAVSESARAIALDVAVLTQDGPLAAELIEGSRFQVLRASGVQQRGLGVHQLRDVTVRGVSRLHPYRNTQQPLPPIPLEDAVSALASGDALWWGAWMVGGAIYWATMAGQSFDCGFVDGSGGGRYHSLLKDAYLSSLANEETSLAAALSGPWSRSQIAEGLLSRDLGAALIPEGLAHVLDQPRADARALPTLIVSGNVASILPLPLLFLPSQGQFSPKRLVETCVSVIAPPASLVSTSERTTAYSPRPVPRSLLLSCLDSRDDLPYARGLPCEARTALIGSSEVTSQRVKLALSSVAPGEPGVFFFSGHASQVVTKYGVDDALVLGDGYLTTSEILGDTNIHFPECCVLSACSSGGYGGAGAGEWLGLSAVMMERGARYVIGTAWRLLDTPFTADFDAEIVAALMAGGSPAAVLREAQIEGLRQWRQSRMDLEGWTGNDLPPDVLNEAFPLIWGAYACSKSGRSGRY